MAWVKKRRDDMSDIKKGSAVEKQATSADELALVNQFTMRELTADEVFTFKLAACDNQIDRDLERFSDQCLEQLAKLYPGKPVLLDHSWSAKNQTARVYAAAVEPIPGTEDGKRLVLRCYMLRSEDTQTAIDALEAGIRKECSVGCAVGKTTCSVCSQDIYSCQHIRGREYDGKMCYVILDEAADAYEVSLVAVPAQPGAGVVKGKGLPKDPWTKKARQMLDLESVRFGAERH